MYRAKTPGGEYHCPEEAMRENTSDSELGRTGQNQEPRPIPTSPRPKDITISYDIDNASTAESPADYNISNSGSVEAWAGSAGWRFLSTTG